jgi:hypothetical protein
LADCRSDGHVVISDAAHDLLKWGKLLSDVPAAGAILDRLFHHAEIIAISGQSYRLQSKAKQPTAKANRSGKLFW